MMLMHKWKPLEASRIPRGWVVLGLAVAGWVAVALIYWAWMGNG